MGIKDIDMRWNCFKILS